MYSDSFFGTHFKKFSQPNCFKMKNRKIPNDAKIKIYRKNEKMECSAFGAAKKGRKWQFLGGVPRSLNVVNSRYLHY